MPPEIHPKSLVTAGGFAYPWDMKRLLPLAICAALTLNACSTLEGMKSDITQSYSTVADAFARSVDPVKEQKKQLPVYDGKCPGVSVRPDLAHMVEFTDTAKPSDKTKTSEITITGVDNTCRMENDGIVMQVDISLSGKTGPKARVKSGDKPSFAYPYFVAVVDQSGMVLSKEIFAASVAYGSKQNEITQGETIFQTMPVPDSGVGDDYSVVVGFQLSADQLAYNQQHGLTQASAPFSGAGNGPAQAANH